jgi:1-acyl-sn-glycerol-3-phosphate acyltransferase
MKYAGSMGLPIRFMRRFFRGLPESAYVTAVILLCFGVTYRLWNQLSTMLGPDPAANGKLMWEIVRNEWVPRIEELTNMRIRIRGEHNVDPSRRYVVVTNHTSTLDIFAVAKAVPWGMYVAKSEIVRDRYPVISHALLRCGQVVVDRNDTAQAIRAVNEGVRRLPQASPIFFAEGTRSPDGHIRPFKKGPFRTAIDNDLPVLPIVISGSHRALPKGTLIGLKRFSDVVVECLPPIETKTLGPAELGYLTDLVQSQVMQAYYSNPLNPRKPASLA